MAGQPHRSGGSNKLPIDLHVMRGTYSPSRHGAQAPHTPATAISPARRRRLLDGLEAPGRRICADLLGVAAMPAEPSGGWREYPRVS